MGAVLGKRCIVDDPDFDRSMPFDRRQNHLTHFCQHWFVSPRRIGNKMQQLLMLHRNLGWRCRPRDRLPAPADLPPPKHATNRDALSAVSARFIAALR